MIRDRIVALQEFTAATVGDPLALGALRGPGAAASWQADVEQTLREGRRAVLSGDISNLPDIASFVRNRLSENRSAQVALLIHWSQAFAVTPERHDLHCFESIYVALDEDVSASVLRSICNHWPTQWVLLPRVGISWSSWIPKILNTKPRGYLTVLTPMNSSAIPQCRYLSPDELSLHIAQLSIEHPLVKIYPAPHEWFAPSELTPWGLKRRDPKLASVMYHSRVDSQSGGSDHVSFVVPFRWTGAETELSHLKRCLASIEEARQGHSDWELIVSVDRDVSIPPVSIAQIVESHKTDLKVMVVVDNPRATGSFEFDGSDWRAGFIRNSGTLASGFTNGYFAFLDSDVRIAKPGEVKRYLEQLNSDLLQVIDANEVSPSFQNATSSFLAMRKSLFKKLGGFADGFNRYGCEDNFLVWSAQNVGAIATALPADCFEHLRDRTAADSAAGKMIRLRSSASLMYRMTLDPAVHAHLYSALGEGVWLRATLKRALLFHGVRWIMGPIVFLLTLLQSTSRKKYLFGFYEIASWFAHRHSWKIPVYFRRFTGMLKKYWVVWVVVPTVYLINRPKHWYRWIFPPIYLRLKALISRRRGSRDI